MGGLRPPKHPRFSLELGNSYFFKIDSPFLVTHFGLYQRHALQPVLAGLYFVGNQDLFAAGVHQAQ